jgi:hypothetical protein
MLKTRIKQRAGHVDSHPHDQPVAVLRSLKSDRSLSFLFLLLVRVHLVEADALHQLDHRRLLHLFSEACVEDLRLNISDGFAQLRHVVDATVSCEELSHDQRNRRDTDCRLGLVRESGDDSVRIDVDPGVEDVEDHVVITLHDRHVEELVPLLKREDHRRLAKGIERLHEYGVDFVSFLIDVNHGDHVPDFSMDVGGTSVKQVTARHILTCN